MIYLGVVLFNLFAVIPDYFRSASLVEINYHYNYGHFQRKTGNMAGETRNRFEDCERTPLLSQSKSSKEVTGNGKRQRARKETSTCTILSIYFLCVTFLCVLAFAFGCTLEASFPLIESRNQTCDCIALRFDGHGCQSCQNLSGACDYCYL